MNYLEQEYLKDGLANPQNRSEEAMKERIEELEDKIGKALYCCSEDVEDSEAVQDSGDLAENMENIKHIRRVLKTVNPLAQKIKADWFEENEHIPDPETRPLEWLCISLASLENEYECLAETALSAAYASMHRLSDVCLVLETVRL